LLHLLVSLKTFTLFLRWVLNQSPFCDPFGDETLALGFGEVAVNVDCGVDSFMWFNSAHFLGLCCSVAHVSGFGVLYFQRFVGGIMKCGLLSGCVRMCIYDRGWRPIFCRHVEYFRSSISHCYNLVEILIRCYRNYFNNCLTLYTRGNGFMGLECWQFVNQRSCCVQ
jgi:hypothetical protein